MTAAVSPLPRTSASTLTDAVYERLRADLLSCRIPPGERLRISEAAGQLGVSPGAVREALSRLTSEGLVVAEPQRGFRAAPVSIAELRDLTEVRVEIEAMCLRRAFAAGGVAWESAVVAAHHLLTRIPMCAPGAAPLVADEWARAHHAFHDALVAACDSPTLLQIRRQLYAQAERYRRLSVPLSGAPRDLEGEHAAIFEAALRRDAAGAVALLTRHIEETTRRVIEGLSLD